MKNQNLSTEKNAVLQPLTALYNACRLCPRACGVDRRSVRGFCGSGVQPKLARAALHMWEEPCISGVNGSGTVFFSGCTLRCCFCQNYRISCENFGKKVTEERLAEIFLELQAQGAHNINLVTATQYLPSVIGALERVRGQLRIPLVYNCGGYECAETLRLLAPYVDIWLPDLKYKSAALARTYSRAEDYFEQASRAIRLMTELAGPPVFEEFCPESARTKTADIASESLAIQKDILLGIAGEAATDIAFKEAPAAAVQREAQLDKGNTGTDLAARQQPVRLMKRGVIVRHMVLPGHRDDSIALLDWMAAELPRDSFLLSLLSQYTPFYKSAEHPEINRRLTSYEYGKVLDHAIELGLTAGYMQEKSSAREEYTPPFELQGV